AGQCPWHTGILYLRDDLLILVESPAYNIRLYSNLTGKLLATSERLQSQPWSIGMLDKSGSCIAVALWNGTIQIFSIQSNEISTSIKSTRTLVTQMKKCYAVCSIAQGNELVVTGPYKRFHCFTVLSSLGEVHGKLCKICTYGGLASFLAKSNDELDIYVSCSVCHDSPDNGVYCFNLTSGKCKFKYRRNLKLPRGICVDSMGYIFVCDQNTSCIHQMTGEGEPVAVFGELNDIPAEPMAISFNQNCHELLVTSWARNEVSRFRLIHDVNIPAEILRMDEGSLQMYKEALQEGMEKVFNIRVMVVGHYGVGKTTLTKRLLGEDVNIFQRKSTEGIDVHTHCCRVSLDTWEWETQHKEAEKYARLQRLVWLLNDHGPKDKVDDGNSAHIDFVYETDVTSATANSDVCATDASDLSTTLKPDIAGSAACNNALGPDRKRKHPKDTERKDQIVELVQMVNENAADLKNRTKQKYAGVTMMDFAGQYAFYTTHPMFMTSRAIYILVIDLSQQITDIVTDNECFFDCDGIKLHMVHEFVEVWLNSIHSIAPPNAVGNPPVVLVATHLDKIPAESRQVAIDRYFQEIRSKLKDQPTRLHLANHDFALDNTRLDPILEDLKGLITDLARKQPFWGEEVPARWLPLEQTIMALKDSGVKVVLFELVKEMNQSGSVQIQSEKELDLFLRFQHEKGTIIYFSANGLKDKIVLDPIWLIDALKTIITAKMFIYRNNPAITGKWDEFEKNGKLTPELIGAVWTKESNSDFHENKEHILPLMEKLNIIAKPRSFNERGDEVKAENYYIVPCMLSQCPRSEVECIDSLVPVSEMKNNAEFMCKWHADHVIESREICKFWFETKELRAELEPDNPISWHPLDLQDERPSDRQLSRLSLRIGREFHVLGLELGISEAEIQQIQIENPFVATQCFMILFRWAQRNVGQATFKNLERALRNVGADIEILTTLNEADDFVSCLSTDALDTRPTEQELKNISVYIGKEFVHLGVELGIHLTRIEQIRLEFPGSVARQSLEILFVWRAIHAGHATFRNLERAFWAARMDANIINHVLSSRF
ncbi:hypothetical protein ACJMK2_014974, partial [Sinanodonta woodiana]